MVFSKTYKWLTRFLYVALLCTLIAGGMLIAWVVTGPRSLDAVTPYIESALGDEKGAYAVHIGGSQLIWDGVDNPIGLQGNHVDIINSKGAAVAYFPEIRIHLSLWKLLFGKIDVRSLEIQRPLMLLIEQEDGTVSFGFGDTENAASNPLAAAIAVLVAEDSPQRIKSLKIRHARVSVRKSHSGVFLQSDDASLTVLRTHGIAKGTLEMPLKFADKHGEFETDFTINGKDKTVAAETVYTDIPFSVLHDLMPTQPLFESIKLTASGWTHAISDFDGTIHSIDFMADTGAGSVTLPKLFPEPLLPTHVHAEGTVSDKLTTCTLTKALVDFKGYSLTAKGTIHKEGEHYAIDGHAETAQFPVESLQYYWPLPLAPIAREWVTTHAIRGIVPQASVDLHFKMGEMELKDIPDESVSASIVLHNGEIRYLPHHPAVTQIDGVIKFTGETMLATIHSAQDFSDTHVTSGTVSFPDFRPDDVRLFMDLNLSAPVKDAISFLSLPDIDKAKSLSVGDGVSGSAEANVKLNFIAFADAKSKSSSVKDSINYAVTATTRDAVLPHLMEKYDVSEANMKLEINNKGIKGQGRASINTVPMEIVLDNSFMQPQTNYTIKAAMPVQHLKNFGYSPPDFLSGVMGVDATFVTSNAKEHDSFKLDLTRTALRFPTHGFEKPAQEEAEAIFETEELPSGGKAIESFSLRGPKIALSGKAELAKDNTVTSALFNQVQVAGHDLDYVEYTKLPDGMKLIAKGKTLNLAPYIDWKDNNTHTILDLNAEKVILGQGRLFTNMSAQSDCANICSSVHVHAHLTPDTTFSYDVADSKVTAASDNAGELLRALGVYDFIHGGKLAVEGAYTGEHIDGILTMTDYTSQKSPILTKMITIASLTGILDAVTGNGISFTKMTAPFEYAHGKIMLKEAKAHGPSLGITADGLIDLTDSVINLQGTLIPSYTLNSIAGNIPLLGKLLTGGTEKGIIALNYSMKGKIDDPSISINPLSVFTPGVLRGIFNIFDQPAPDLDKINTEQQPATSLPSPASK